MEPTAQTAESLNKISPPDKEGRRPYRIIRGQYVRREGPPQPAVDNETGRRTRRRARQFVHYMARTADNPNAKDEIMLTDAEARAFGLHRLKRLFQHDIRTNQDIEDMPFDTQKPKAEVIASLIKIGEGVSGNRAVTEWKKQVLEAKVLVDPMPKTRDEVLEALRALEAEAVAKAQT